jgi:hypothetical protein
MGDQPEGSATISTEAPATSVLSTADLPVVSENESVLDASDAEAKASREANEKRVMEAKDETLSPEDKTLKEGLVKAKQEEADKKLAEIKAKGVPDKYEIKPPEGMTLDQVTLDKVTPMFKEIGLTNAQAQKLSDLYTNLTKESASASDLKFKTWNEANVKETMALPNIKEELKSVAKVKGLYSPETIEALNASGIGNLKCFILDSAKIGKLFSEEHLVNDNITSKPHSATGETREETASKFYPTMK